MRASPTTRFLFLQTLLLITLFSVNVQCEHKAETDQIEPYQVSKRNPDRTQAEEWFRQGLAHLDSTNYEQALVYFASADTIYRKLAVDAQDSLLLSNYLSNTNNRAKALSRIMQTDSALSLIDEAITWGNTKFPAGSLETTKSLYIKGSIFLDKGRYAEAADWYQKALETFNRLGYGQSLDAALCGSFLGLVISYRDIDSGYEQISDAVKIAATVNDSLDPRVADIYHLYASVLQTKYGAAEALAYYDQALAIKLLHYGPNHLSVSRTYNNMAIAYFHLGEYEKSLELQKINQGIREQISPVPHRYLASTYLNIGIIYERLQEYDEALKYYDQAYQHTLESVGRDHLQSLRISYAVIAVLKNKGQYQQAVKLAKENIESFGETLKEDPGLAASHYDILGSVYLELRLLDSAYHYTNTGLEAKISYYGKDSYPVAASYDHMGKVLSAQQEYPLAIKYHQKGRALFQQMPEENPDAFVYTLRNLAHCHADLLAFDEAIRYIQEGIRLLAPDFTPRSSYDNPPVDHASVNPYLLWFMANNKGEILHQKFEQTQSVEDARACLQTYYWADSLLTSLRTDLFWEESRAGLVGGDARKWQNSAVVVASQAYALDRDTAFLELCFYFMERSRALLLTEAVESRNFAPASLQTWFEQEKKLKKKIHEVERNLQEEQTKEHPDQSLLSRLQDTIFQGKEEFVGHIESLRQDQPDYYYARFQPQGPELSDVQASLADEATLLIEYQLGTEGLIVLAADKEKTTLHQQPLKPLFFEQLAALRACHQEFRPGLAQSDVEHAKRFRQFVNLSRAMYDTLLREVLVSRPHIKKLIIIPHGELGYLPFDLLLSQEVAGADYRSLPYLLKDYTVRYEYSAGFAMAEAPKETTPDRGFVGFAPDYEEQAFLAHMEQPDSIRVAASFPGLRGNLEPLQFNQAEVAEIAELLGGHSHLGRQATKAAFAKGAKKAAILHLAMHAFVNDTFPDYSHLVFAAPSASGGQAKMFAYELYNMDLDARLAVLSACETGAGKTMDGEGIMSLSRAFKYTGCPNIVTSLWKVHDQNSKDLMVEFYANLKRGLGKAAALRQAKLTFLNKSEERYTDPFYWGSFVLVGDDLAMDLPEDSPPFGYWIAGGVIFIGLLLFGWNKMSKNQTADKIT